MKTFSYLIALLLLVGACSGSRTGTLSTTRSGLSPEAFVAEVGGKTTALYVLSNAQGMEVCITNYGGRIVSIMVPDRDGQLRDVVLGFDSIQDYLTYSTDFGATIGRYANRIAQGRFALDGTTYVLPQNNYGHCLHGGPLGYQVQVFDAEQHTDTTLTLRYLSADGEEGFPGNLQTEVTFTLKADNALDIRYRATTDHPTIVNLTNHSYFNLNGDPSTGNAHHLLWIDADHYTPVDDTFMTTGEIATVEGTPMDFRTPTPVGARIDEPFEQLLNGKGYDHNWVLNTRGDDQRPCAALYAPLTGIKMEVFTNEPGMQVYAGNFLDGTLTGKRGVRYDCRASICLETQKYPDTPNKPEWPSAVLRPDEVYDSHCVYRFSVE